MADFLKDGQYLVGEGKNQRLMCEQCWTSSSPSSLLASEGDDHKHEIQVKLRATTRMTFVGERPAGGNTALKKEARTQTFVLPVSLPDGSTCSLEVVVDTVSTMPMVHPST